jgi:hypothetical protein
MSPPALEQHLSHIDQLTRWLRRHRPLWEHRTFVEQPAPWEREHRELAAWLRGLSPERIDALDADLGGSRERIARAPEPLPRWAREAAALTAVPDLSAPPEPALGDPRLPVYVPLRKWRQVQAFISALRARFPAGVHRLVDWCAGKGHLGRTFAEVTGLPVTLVERRAGLCRVAARLADRLGTRCETLEADAHDAGAAAVLGPGVGAVALHACGALTDEMMQQAVDRQVRFIAAVPCCYHHLGRMSGLRLHRPRGPQHDSTETALTYQPRSEAGRERDLRLTAHLLRLPIYDEVVAPPRDRDFRRREMTYRAGFDLLVREATGEDRYFTPGNLRPRVVRLGFEGFCREASRRSGLPLPLRWDPERWEAAGAERTRVARALGLVRAVFRRPLELWLVLDRALALAEAGRPVELGTFCPREVTPRNLLIWSPEP